MDTSKRYWLLLALSLLITAIAYAPGLGGYFLLDDRINIVENQALQIESLDADALLNASLTGAAGPLNRPLSMFSFALNHYFFGLDPYYFKLVNLFIHLLNGLGLFVLTRLLLSAARHNSLHRFDDKAIVLISLATASLWLVHPLNMTSVLYIVQRMNSLSALFTIYGLTLYAYGRLRLMTGRKGFWTAFAGVTLFTVLSMLSKENGILLPLFALTFELAIFRFSTESARQQTVIKALWGGFAGLLVVGSVLLLSNPHIITDSYAGRVFTLEERLLTEFRVVSGYIGMILLPAISGMSLFHDDIQLSLGLLSPPSTLFSVLFIAGLLVIAWATRRVGPFICAGIVFFFVGHSIESTVLGLEIAHEHRNYLPQYGILLALIVSVAQHLERQLGNRAAVVAVSSLMLFVAGSTYVRASYWGDHSTYLLVEATHKPRSPRAQMEAGILYTHLASATQNPKLRGEYLERACRYFETSYKLHPASVDGLFALVQVKSQTDGEAAGQYFDELERRLTKEPFATNSANQIRGLIACKREGRCSLSDAQIEALLRAALENPSLKGPRRSYVLSEAAVYLFRERQNYQDAVHLAHQAVLETPGTLKYRIILVQMLTALGNAEQANQQLEELKRANRLGLHQDTIRKLEAKIAVARHATGQHPR